MMDRDKHLDQLKWVITGMGVLVSVLFSGNVYFVVRAMNKLESLEQITYQLRQDVAVMNATNNRK